MPILCPAEDMLSDCSGMRPMYRKAPARRGSFRPADNSLFSWHLTHISLLCFFYFRKQGAKRRAAVYLT